MRWTIQMIQEVVGTFFLFVLCTPRNIKSDLTKKLHFFFDSVSAQFIDGKGEIGEISNWINFKYHTVYEKIVFKKSLGSRASTFMSTRA